MDNRTRIINTVLCKEVDRLPFFFCFGPWGETIKRWNQEGLAEGTPWTQPFGFDPGFVVLNKVNLGYLPGFKHEVLEEKEDTVIVRDGRGITKECRKNGSSIPKFLDYPVKTADDWQKLKERLDPHDERRFPPDWKEITRKCNEGDRVVQIGQFPYGLFGTARDIMGVESLLISFYDEPELIHDIMDYLTDFWLTIYEKAARDVKIDAIHIWEDMSGKQGSLISPAMFREFMLPNYKKIKKFADEHDIPIVSVDTDGNVSELVPLFIEGGVNLVFPFEVAAGCDINEYRQMYPNLCIMGGIDKQKIALGKDAIDAELDRIKDMFKYSGYIPSFDHLIHPQVSWEDFNYFVKRLKEYIFSNTNLKGIADKG